MNECSVGDRVEVSTRHGKTLATVTRTTATQVLVRRDGSSAEMRFNKKTGAVVGGTRTAGWDGYAFIVPAP